MILFFVALFIGEIHDFNEKKTIEYNVLNHRRQTSKEVGTMKTTRSMTFLRAFFFVHTFKRVSKRTNNNCIRISLADSSSSNDNENRREKNNARTHIQFPTAFQQSMNNIKSIFILLLLLFSSKIF